MRIQNWPAWKVGWSFKSFHENRISVSRRYLPNTKRRFLLEWNVFHISLKSFLSSQFLLHLSMIGLTFNCTCTNVLCWSLCFHMHSQLFTVKLGYNKLGHNKLLVISNRYFPFFRSQVNVYYITNSVIITNCGLMNKLSQAVCYNHVWL